MNTLPHSHQESRIIRLPEVERRTGFKRSHIYNLMSEGLFPKTIRIGTRAVGWDAEAIDRWISERIQEQPWRQDYLSGGHPSPMRKNDHCQTTWA